jgi:hypothetical protein
MAKRQRKSGGSRPPIDETDARRDASALKEVQPRLSIASDFALGKIIDSVRPRPAEEFRVPVRRPDDMLVFDILVDNLTLKTDGYPRLERTNAIVSAHLMIEFPPQSFGEEAFLEVSTQSEPAKNEPHKEASGVGDPPYPSKNVAQGEEAVPSPLPSARVRMSGRSRLAFLMPASVPNLPFALADVLKAMRTWPLSLPMGALPDPDPPSRVFERVDDVTLGEFLSTAVASDSWKVTQVGLSSALNSLAGAGFDQAVHEAAGRVSARAAGGLTREGGTGFGKAMFEAIDREMDDLFRRRPELRDGPAHQASIAAVALASMEALAPAARRADSALGLLSEIPFFQLFLSPHEPARTATALELPYRLVISPIEQARWQHQDQPVVHNGRTELWHTRMTTGSEDVGPDLPGKIRAVWSPDYDIPNVLPLLKPQRPFRMSLDPLDRTMLVKLMARWGYPRGDVKRLYTPRSSQAKRLQLSSLGGLLDAEGNWKPRPDDVDLEQWRHLATLGRDHYVRVVYAGFMCPFGHAASLVKVTERKFQSLAKNPAKRIAVLRQRFFIVIRERVRRYVPSDHVHGGRNFPFDEVEIVTRSTPDLFQPGVGASELKAAGGVIYDNATVTRRMVFWPMVPGTSGSHPVDFPFEVVATGIDGRRATFSVPLLFVGEIANRNKHAEIRSAYNAEVIARRTGDLAGETISYAPPEADDVADTLFPTDRMTFGSGPLANGRVNAAAPNFYPETAAAVVGVPALQKLLGRPEVIEVTYPEEYKTHGFGELSAGKNAGKVFLQVLTQPFKLEFGGGAGQSKSDTLGALATPQMSILGLSKTMGPVAGQDPANAADVASKLANALASQFNPADFFKGATILGGIELATILSAVTGLAGPKVPKLVSRELDAPKRVESSFKWATEITLSDPANLFIHSAGGPTQFVMDSLITTPLGDPSQADYKATARLTNFKVNLFGFIILWFDRLTFDSTKGQKPDVAVALHGSDAVRFGGPLEFVNTLRELIPSNGFSDPPSLSVTPSGISASYSLNLPAIQVGVFALSNASLGAGFNLPFDATPMSVRFNFSERQRPFSLTVSLLGGGGFFAIGISAKGVQEIEAALEFGAALEIDLGVASGGVEIKAGVYFHWLEAVPGKGLVELAGYIRIHGELSVLGLISVSITFNLQLSFRKENHESSVWGEATLVVEVEVLFFSADVSVRCRKEFGGAASDPKFIDLIPNAATWTEYCGAFASEGV